MKKLSIVLSLLFIFLVYKIWFTGHIIAGGDFSFYYPEAFIKGQILPSSWDMVRGSGMGGTMIQFLWPYYLTSGIAILLAKLAHVPWFVSERLVYFFPFLLISFFSIRSLLKRFTDKSLLHCVGYIIFTTNTYILMAVAGGQMSIGLAYALVPAIISLFWSHVEKPRHQTTILLGTLLAFQTMYDFRIVYITVIICVILFICISLQQNFMKKIPQLILNLGIVSTIVIILNLFWILPTLLLAHNPVSDVGIDFSTIGILRFLSFGTLDYTFALLHPNWPNNTFGQVPFLKPIFLLVPLIAFSSLLLPGERKKKMTVVWFSCITLVGVFLAKGVNPPLGGIYYLLFQHLPGFVLFRDPSKWYVISAVGYSVLCVLSIDLVTKVISIRSKIEREKLVALVSILFLILWSVMIHQATFGKLPGLLSSAKIPPYDIQVMSRLSHDQTFYRTMLIPSVNTITPSLPNHPALSAEEYFHVTSSAAVMKSLTKPGELQILEERGVRYIYVLPELLSVKGKKVEHMPTIPSSITSYTGAPKIIDGLMTLILPHPRDRFFFIDETDTALGYHMDSQTRYHVVFSSHKHPGRLVFADSYDSQWQFISKGELLKNDMYHGLNSAIIPAGASPVTVSYLPQRYVIIGSLWSGVGLIVVLLAYLYARKKKI